LCSLRVYRRKIGPSTSWSRTRNTTKINNLAVGIPIEIRFDMLFPDKNLQRLDPRRVDSHVSMSMRLCSEWA
jgi:hypothetical protein